MEITRHFAYELSTRDSIKAAADSLVAHLDSKLADADDPKNWTLDNFNALDSFSLIANNLRCFHKFNDNEFLWDYIACDNRQGIFLVAESEQASGPHDYALFPLKHDFEKLLYVFAPLHLMICKAGDVEDAERIADVLSEYAEKCSSNFQGGSVFVLYCRVKRGKNTSYIWQAPGDPQPISLATIKFSY